MLGGRPARARRLSCWRRAPGGGRRAPRPGPARHHVDRAGAVRQARGAPRIGRHARRRRDASAGDTPAQQGQRQRLHARAAVTAGPDDVALLGAARARQHEGIAVVAHVGARRRSVGGGDEHRIDAVRNHPGNAEHVVPRSRARVQRRRRVATLQVAQGAAATGRRAAQRDDRDALARLARRSTAETPQRRRFADIRHRHDPGAGRTVGAQQARGLRVDGIESLRLERPQRPPGQRVLVGALRRRIAKAFFNASLGGVRAAARLREAGPQGSGTTRAARP